MSSCLKTGGHFFVIESGLSLDPELSIFIKLLHFKFILAIIYQADSVISCL
jgi:hypothetical protein